MRRRWIGSSIPFPCEPALPCGSDDFVLKRAREFRGVVFSFEDARPVATALESLDRHRYRRTDPATHPLCPAGTQAGRRERAVDRHLRLLAARLLAALSARVAISTME